MNQTKEQRSNMAECDGLEEGSDTTTPARIARLNDALRQTGRGGRIVLTHGVQAMGAGFMAKAIETLRAFNAFDDRNDPYGEHDCALIAVDAQNLLWKIDYYDTALSFHSPDPADPEITCRILTLMLADEY